MRHLAITVVMLLLAACVAYSVNPISPPESAKPDSRLFGTWYNPEEPDAGFLHIGPNKNGPGLTFVIVDFENKDNALDYAACSGHTSRIDDNSYLNIKSDCIDEKSDSYIFLKYVVENGTMLDLLLMEPTPVSDAIERGELKGRLEEQGKKFSSPLITDESQNIAEFIRKHDKELFEEHLSPALSRLQLPAAKQKETEEDKTAPQQDKGRQPGNAGADGSSGQLPAPPSAP